MRQQAEPFRYVRAGGRPGLLRLSRWEEEHPVLTAGMTTRLGGVSKPPYDSLNAALHVGDDPAAVLANRRLIAEEAGMPVEAFTCAEQVHGCGVAVVTPKERGRGRGGREDALQDCDAMIANEPGILLAAWFADCVPLWFYDPVRQAIGLAHAGWKGTALDVAGKTVRRMAEAFGSRPEDIRAAIGPSIGACCYQVDDTVVARLRETLAERDLTAGEAIRPDPAQTDKYRLDLKEINRKLLKKAGILPFRIEVTEWCTGCNPDLLYSHRMEGGKTGRMTAWIGLKDERI
ncbi:peptidoglycan editing factor PgeF [Paenibacillus thermoaerophilus]|uniref:Purine nucleoside phosphorylase n=1 Tax=Paenibacillus thermoaerophilus TaxID=1215385 RepID=A0ABW2V1N6_9BACL|nr:peptidoglycan editing factor PgeF [Paenibacillus thermoaerophilus]TMV19089.1 peptidoglycan editing factor PgeF [Paenibacillus thermoaerophilus]